MLSGLFVIVLIILFVPRLIEDYVKLYNWYINSDFFQIFEEKASIRLIIKIIFSPILLFIALLFSIVNIIVRTGYQIVLKLQLLYCINCSSYISFNEEEMICPYCGEIHKGTPDTSCPKCNFKANSIYCPYCGFLVFIDLTGKKSLEQRKK
jgi:DNA-directed RNA polymerase subunit RPC12/RpoP